MPLPPIPSYTFATTAGQRRFVHRWHHLGTNKVIECNKCGTTCRESDAYSQHWLQQKAKLNEVSDELNNWLKTDIMKRQPDIVRQNIESFMLCNAKVTQDTQQFLLDAGTTAIPDLLSVLYATDQCKALTVKLRFHVKIEDEMFAIQTSDLEIKHHSDIRESVDVMFLMSLEKLRTFMTFKSLKDRDKQHKTLQLSEYSIKRICISAQRIPLLKEEKLKLPLQYRKKNACKPITTAQQKHDLKCLTWAFRQHLKTDQKQHFKPPFICNLYCFRTCPNSRELYTVPYHYTCKPKEFLKIPCFIILQDIRGEFQQLQEIDNIRKFLHIPQHDKVLTCRRCEVKFMQLSDLHLHLMLNCGQDFEIFKIDPESIEIYERCYELMRSPKWILYGIGE